MHSLLAPSSAAVWSKCVGSIGLCLFFPENTESEASLEGTLAHELCAKYLFAEGNVEDDGSEMYQAIKMYGEDILAVYRKRPHTMINVERSISIPRIHKECFGTPDAFLYDEQKHVLFVWDFKYGFGEVDVFENEQLICYASGIIDTLGISDMELKVVFRIVQPRAFASGGPIREWACEATELRNHINRLANAAQAAMEGGDCVSGNHCKYCSARHGCESALKAGIALYEQVSTPTPLDMSDAQLSVVYGFITRAEKQIEYLKTGFEAEIMARIKGGRNVPNWAITQKLGNRKWSVSEAELLEYGDLLGIELRAPSKAISPTDAEKILDKATYLALEGMVTRPLGSARLAPIDNKKIKEVFNK